MKKIHWRLCSEEMPSYYTSKYFSNKYMCRKKDDTYIIGELILDEDVKKWKIANGNHEDVIAWAIINN